MAFLLSVSFVCYFYLKKKPGEFNVVLITIDALRADHLGCYGYKRDTSPNIDRLAREGVLFTQAIAQSSHTPPSVGAITASSYPPVSRLHGWGRGLNPSIPTLPKTLKAHGYKTIFVDGNGHFRKGLRGFSRGFDEFYEKSATAAILNLKVSEFLEESFSSPFFLWVHYMDVHDFKQEGRFKNAFMHDPFYDEQKKLPIVKPSPGLYGHNGIPAWLAKKHGGVDNPDYYTALYDASILSVDAQIGWLLQKLKKTSGGRNTLVILTSDHGEMMGELGYYFDHGRFLYEPLIRVPFILYDPGFLSAQKFDSQIRAGLDIFPTILGFLKIAKPENLEGVDLLQLLAKNGAASPSYVLSDDAFYERSVRTSEWKFIYAPAEGDLPEAYKLFHLKNDPGETTDVSSVEKNIFSVLKEKLMAYMDKYAHEKKSKLILSEEARRSLRTLGYLQ